MSYDKYRNWRLPQRSGNIYPVYQGQGLEEQVLRDLAATEDEVEKLEILDSYGAYAQRAYQAEVAGALALLAGRIFTTLLEPNIPFHLPLIQVSPRARVAKAETGE